MTDNFDATTLLERAVLDLPRSAAPVRAMIEGGQRLEHRRRRIRHVAVAAAASASVAAVILVFALVPSAESPTPRPAEPVDHGMPDPSMTPDEVFAWAQELPEGPAAQVSYVVDQRIVVSGADRLELPPGTQVELEGVLPGGWLVLLGGTDENGNWIDVRTGFLSAADGTFRAFDFKATRRSPDGRARGLAVSPDGSQVAYDGWVVDVATGQPVAEIPGRPWTIYGWPDAGLLYSDNQDGCCTTFLWRPGTARQELRDVDGFETGLAETYGHRCIRYSQINDDGTLRFVARVCDDGLAAVSQGGLMVTGHGLVLDQDGDQIAHLDLPVPDPGIGPFDRGCCGLAWEGDNLLVTVSPDIRPIDESRPSLLVRCRVDAEAEDGLRCERASTVVDGITWGYYVPVP